MADHGHELTDKKLKALERKIAREYRKANEEVAAKLQAYLEETEEKRKVQEELLRQGKITQKQYSDWCFRHTMTGKRWEAMRDTLAQDYHNANGIALQIARGGMSDIYALNANFATYQLEHDGEIDTSFTLYNHDTAEYLLSEQRTLMPGPSTQKQREIAQNKDLQWNKQKIQSCVLQGVLQGESPYAVARRLMQVGQMNYNAAVRYARTMTTNAQNAGRYQAFERADRLGVDLTIEWQATLDHRTRHEHRMMHGQRRDVGEPFVIDGVKILWPAQVNYNGTDLPQQLIWNCRCTLLSWVKGVEGETVKHSPKMGKMSFEEWQEAKPRRESSDYEQYERYKKALGKKAPKTFAEFEDIKYDSPGTWSSLKTAYREETIKARRATENEHMAGSGGLSTVLSAAEHNNSAETIQQLEEYARNAGVRVYGLSSFSGSPELLREQIDAIQEGCAELGIKRRVKVALLPWIDDETLGAVNRERDVIQILDSALRSREATNRYLNADRTLAATDMKGISYHELGHILVHERGEKGLVIAKRAYYNIFKQGTDADVIAYMRQNVSIYCTTQKTNPLGKKRKAVYSEIIPEVYSLHKTSPTAFTEEFMRVLREEYGL